MPDDPYASIAKPIDPYADIAKPISEPVTRASTFGGGMIEGAKDLGQGLMNIPQAVLHPVDTFNAMGAQQRALADRASADAKAGHYGNAAWHAVDSMLPGLGLLDAQLTDEYQSGAPGAKAAAMGRTLVNAAPNIVAAGARPMLARAVPRLGAEVNNIAIGADADAKAFGANPGRGLYNNGIAGFSPASLNTGIKAAIPPASAAVTNDLVQAGPRGTVQLGTAINDPFDQVVEQKVNPVTGAVLPAQVAKARNVQSALNHVPDPASGRPTPALRNLNAVSPVDANTLKSNIYGMTDYDNPSRSNLANTALKGAASNIRGRILNAVPEARGSMQNLHDLMEARDVVAPAARGYQLPTSKGGIVKNALMGAATYGTQAAKLGAVGLRGPLTTGIPLAVAPRTELIPQAANPAAGSEGQSEQIQDPNESPDQSVPQGDSQANTEGNLEDEQHSGQSIPENETNTFPQASIGALPGPVQRLLSSTGLNLQAAKPHMGAQGNPAIASVDPGSPNTINIEDPQRFNQSGTQTLSHEAVHLWHNNLPPRIQAQIPEDDPKDPYSYGGAEGLKSMRDQGMKLWNLPREKAATVVQYYASQGGKDAPKAVRDAYEPWVKDMNNVPLSAIRPTDPRSQSLDTSPRAPLGQMYATKTFAKGEPEKIQKGTPVTLPDGSRGKVAHVIEGMNTVRVRTEDGRNLTVRAKALTVLPHVMVTAHARRITPK